MALPEALSGLLLPGAYSHPVQGIELVETHISWVLLTGTYAYKIKRPVHYAFIDLRSAERRAQLCEEELRLNRRFAPALYLQVCPITLDKGLARMGGEGPAIEHAVRMRQFPRANELDAQLAAGALPAEALRRFGDELSLMHAALPVAPKDSAWGLPSAVAALISRNLEQCAAAAAATGYGARVLALLPLVRAWLERLEPWFKARRAQGRVRECHGDLHAANVALLDGALIAFDCLEYAEEFRWIDQADEVAFLMADLQARGFPAAAQAFLSGYLSRGGDYQACCGLPLYRAHRALVRAKVAALSDASRAGRHGAPTPSVQDYLAVAEQALKVDGALMVLMHGYSGSGKSVLAERLASALQGVQIRSDIERRRTPGAPAAPERYEPLARQQVYSRLAAAAQAVVEGGYAAIVDATFLRRADRAQFVALAQHLGVPLRLVDCKAPLEVLRERVATRSAAHKDPSEADLQVLELQLRQADPLTKDEGLQVLSWDSASAEDLRSWSQLLSALAQAHRPAPPG